MKTGVDSQGQGSVAASWDILNPFNSQPVRGKDAIIGVVDDGIDYTHPDLLARYNPDLSWDFTDNDNDPFPQSVGNFAGNLSNYNATSLDISFNLPVNLTGMITDIDITFDILKSLRSNLPNSADLKLFLYSPIEPLIAPLRWGNSTSFRRFPGWHDLKFAQNTEVDIREDGSVVFDRNKFNGSYAGGVWKLQIQNPNLTKYKKKDLQPLIEQLIKGWSLQITTANPHGTAVAGIAGATEGDGAVVGVAPGAQLAGLRLIGNTDPVNSEFDSTGKSIADALFDPQFIPGQLNRNQYIDIFNNSWGPTYMTRQPLALDALADGFKKGRNGLGNIYVFAAGNDGAVGGNVNYNSFANSPYAIAVGAIDRNGIQAPYSTPGSSLLVSAYSDNGTNDPDYNITTTALNHWYANDFGGTSASAPLVSGVIALMLEANPNLTVRDVQHILVNTAQPSDVLRDTKDNIAVGNGWVQNKAGHWVNYKYGFGAIDAPKAVATAASWMPVEEEAEISSNLQNAIDDIPNGGNDALEPSTIKIDGDITIEKVEVVLDVEHTNWADLKVILTSPDGTESILSDSISNYTNNSYKQLRPDAKQWTFTSVRHWSESSKGDWKLQVFDEKENEFKGVWNSWKLNIYGTKPTVTVSATDAFAAESGDTGELTFTRTGNTEHDLKVNYSVAGTATNGADYNDLDNSVIILAGQSSVTVPITPIDDPEYEGDETVEVNLIADDAYSIDTNNKTTVAIADNDLPTVTIKTTDFNAIEDGNAGQFVVTRTGNTAKALTVNYSIAGNATNGKDYSTLSGSITIPAGAAMATIPIVPLADAEVEQNEIVEVSLSDNAAYNLGTDVRFV